MPDHSAVDIGATMQSTGRAARIEELISNHIISGHKISLEDMRAIQEDVVDVSAREFGPVIAEIARVGALDATTDEQASILEMIKHLDGWQGDHSKDSVAATIYNYALFFFQKSLFHSYIDDAELRLAI